MACFTSSELHTFVKLVKRENKLARSFHLAFQLQLNRWSSFIQTFAAHFKTPPSQGPGTSLPLSTTFLTKPWIILINTKDQALAEFIKFKMQEKHHTGYKVLTLCSKNGGIYKSTAFRIYYENNGIKHEFTQPFTT